MQKKMLWGLGVLVLLICTAFVFMTVRNFAEIRQLKEETAVVEKPLEARDEPTQPIADNKPPRPARAGFKWEWHGDHWHEMPVAQADVQEVVVPVEQMTEAQKTEWLQFWKDQGLEPPPPGHGYWFNKDGSVGGLYKYNEPRFKARWSETESPGADFTKLTETEWIRYHALRHIMGGSVLEITQEMLKQLKDDDPVPKATYAPGVQELAEVWWGELRDKASGPTPQVSTIVTWNRDPTPEELEAIERKEDELMESMRRERPKRERPEWQPYVQQLVKELEAAVAAEKRR